MILLNFFKKIYILFRKFLCFCLKIIKKVNGMSLDQIFECIQKLEIVSPINGNALSEPYYFNLMVFSIFLKYFSSKILKSYKKEKFFEQVCGVNRPYGKAKGLFAPGNGARHFCKFQKTVRRQRRQVAVCCGADRDFL